MKESRMSVQRRLALLNRNVGNRLVGGILTRLPGFGMVFHRGRKSGREYHTPVKLLRSGDSYVMSLPYGPESDWVKNVLAAGGCDLRTRGRRIHLVAPKVFVDKDQVNVPTPLRPLLRRFKAFDFIELSRAA
jgi:deazaflavin-dependent oxidoreductase (nitroreductase family)